MVIILSSFQGGDKRVFLALHFKLFKLKLMRLPPLNAVRAFAVAARHLSFKAAAAELFVTPAAITYQIKTLEDYLEVALFVRENRSISLTPAGQRCFNDVEAGFALIARGIQKAQQDNREHQLVVTAGPAFTIKWLAPRLHEFADQYPALQASVSASLHSVDLEREAVDVGIRFGYRNTDPALHVESFAHERVVPLCHPTLAVELTDKPADLLQHTLIYDDSMLFSQQPVGWREWLLNAGVKVDEAPPGLHFNQADHALQAAIDGSGIVLGRRVLAIPDIMAGRLTVLFPELEMDTGLEHFFVCLRDKLELEKVSCFREWVRGLPFS